VSTEAIGRRCKKQGARERGKKHVRTRNHKEWTNKKKVTNGGEVWLRLRHKRRKGGGEKMRNLTSDNQKRSQKRDCSQK